jgi:hypothetical protein
MKGFEGDVKSNRQNSVAGTSYRVWLRTGLHAKRASEEQHSARETQRGSSTAKQHEETLTSFLVINVQFGRSFNVMLIDGILFYLSDLQRWIWDAEDLHFANRRQRAPTVILSKT